MSDDEKAWSEFWANNSRGDSNGCLPQRWAAIEQAQQAAWFSFIEGLGQGASVLDLATGDGRVLRWMHGRREDLVLEGIDLAPTLPPAPQGTRTQGGVAMEKLPFDDNSFDAVVSQFGFEYGDVGAVATEIARVLAPKGKVGLMVHRGDGPILEHNKKRQRELLWALKDKGTAKKVRTALSGGPAAIDGAAKYAAKIAQQGAKKFGQQSPAWEIPEAIRRSCLMGQRAGVGSIIETIGSIEAQAKNELGRIRSLAGACKTADARAKINASFEAHSLAPQGTQEVCEPSGRALADFITFS